VREGRTSALLLGFLATVALSGCEYFLSDVATRIRYALLDAKAELQKSPKETLTITLRPNHAPDGCKGAAGYRLEISPYRGNKQVATGDISAKCNAGRHYHTGLGSESLYVTRVMTVEKKADDDVRITLRKTSSGVEIVGLE
jgi:hypothetical protein